MFDDAPSAPASGDIAYSAAYGLKESAPEHSAAGVLSPAQKIIGCVLLSACAAMLTVAPVATFIVFNAIASFYFIIAIAYRGILMLIGARAGQSPATETPMRQGERPVITILAPLYKDAAAIASLSQAIGALDYPADKKDVKILLEEDDDETLAEARRLGLQDRFELIVVPNIGPRTKPKACNVGLQLARGDLIVIYDAEDQPERDQLIKAAQVFQNADPKLACVQARLNYYNRNDNWLTRLFTLEYSLWFDWLLPALQRLGAPIPLGGTSNFFRTQTLIEVGGWDPYNVTEDADLGLRLSKLGYRVEMLDSTTFEEANCRLGNWIRQRSRWIKGHLQTWLVHMRAPGAILSTTGWSGLLSVQLFLAGNVFSALLNPILWFVFILQLAHGSIFQNAVPAPLQWLNLIALVAGNCCFVAFAAIAPLKRGWKKLYIFGLTAPIYWLFTSVAAYKALWQIVIRPYYWEKTDHVISAAALERRKAALQSAAAN